MAGPVDNLLHLLRPISLETLDQRAALLRRVDHKYIVDRACLARLIDRLREDHDVLEIDADRVFAYDSVYFDTEDLRCFEEHVRGIKPRFKARARRYVDTGACMFEVKVKPEGGGTDKRQTDHPADAADELTRDAEELLTSTLREAGIAAPNNLAPVLRTSFHRVTLAAREGDARLTADLDVRLARLDDTAVCLHDDLALIETKSENGTSPADRALADLGARAISLSKYRTGIDALHRRDETGEVDAARGNFA